MIDNTPPVAILTSPVNCSTIDQGLIQIIGTASDANMGGWSVQYTGGDSHGWTTIASGTTSVVNGVLATWDARALRDCGYAIRLVVSDAVNVSCTGGGHTTEYFVNFNLGSRCNQDYNADGVVNSQDFFDFLTVSSTAARNTAAAPDAVKPLSLERKGPRGFSAGVLRIWGGERMPRGQRPGGDSNARPAA